MRLDLKENIVFPFSDPSWIVKTLIGFACQILFFLFPATIGYQLAIIRQTANGEDDKLPEYSGFGALWMSGLLVSLVLFGLLAMPACGVMFLIAGSTMAFGDSGGAIIGVSIVGVGLVMLLCLAYGFLMPALMLRYAMTGRLGAFFDFSTAFSDIRHGFVDYLVIVLFPFFASLLLAAASGITFGLASVLAPLVMYIQGRMIGNYYRLYFM